MKSPVLIKLRVPGRVISWIALFTRRDSIYGPSGSFAFAFAARTLGFRRASKLENFAVNDSDAAIGRSFARPRQRKSIYWNVNETRVNFLPTRHSRGNFIIFSIEILPDTELRNSPKFSFSSPSIFRSLLLSAPDEISNTRYATYFYFFFCNALLPSKIYSNNRDALRNDLSIQTPFLCEKKICTDRKYSTKVLLHVLNDVSTFHHQWRDR